MCTDKEPLRPHQKLVRLIETGKTYYLEECEEAKHKKRLIFTFDVFLSLFIVAPLIVANWRGTWCLMDVYMDFFPEYETFLFANAIYLGCTIIKGVLKENVKRYQVRYGKSHVWKGLAKVYIYCFNIIGNMSWRAGFIIFDILCGIETDESGNAYPDNDKTTTIYLTLLCTLLLVVFKSLRNVTSAPFVIALDGDHDEVYDFPTRFRVEMVQKTSLYILDCLFSVLVVGTLVVFVWRGAWVLIDIYLIPENEYWSAWASLVLGYMSVAVAFLLQPVMRWLCDRIDGALRLFVADIFLLFSLFGTVNVWRGIWNLLNLYFLPDDMELSCWITHWVSLVLLILLGCSNSLLVRGVYIDAEEPAGKCVVFPCYYLRLIFKQEKQQKVGNVTLEAMSKRMMDIERNDANHVPDGSNHI